VPEDTLNPYAPPVEAAAPADAAGLWRVEGDYLIVREGTMLPRVDLDGRGKGGPLTPVIMRLPVPLDGKGLALTAVGALPVAGYLAYQLMTGGRLSYLWMFGIVIVTQFLFRGVKVRTAPAHVFGYISVPAVRTITRRALWRQRLTVAMLVPIGVIFPLMAAYPSMTRSYDRIYDIAKWAGGMVAVALVILLTVSIWGSFDKGWRCPRFRDGWLWITGIGHEALMGLGARAVGHVPEPVKRRVFKMRLDRMPVEFWRQIHGHGVIGRFRSWWIRLRTKGRPFEQYAFHWSEAEKLTPEEIDPELLSAWRSDTAGTPLADWMPVYGVRAASPAGWDEVNEAAFLSPDGRHVAIPAITRVVRDRKLKETRETHFRSFTSDGRTIATGTMEYVGAMPAEFEFSFVKGSPMAVAAVHLQRAAGEDLVFLDGDKVRRREERELQLRHELMEVAGIYGPTEEMDFFRP
jgi:hypothetical protein